MPWWCPVPPCLPPGGWPTGWIAAEPTNLAIVHADVPIFAWLPLTGYPMKFGNLAKLVTEVSHPSIKFQEGDSLLGAPKFVEEKFPQFAELL